MYNCLYVLFYRGPLGRLANLAKSETLLKYCINKNKIARGHSGTIVIVFLKLFEKTKAFHTGILGSDSV